VSDSVVIIPTYNELENVERMTRKVMSLEKDFHIVYIDDASPDGTAEKIIELQNEFPGRVHLERRE
jgi:dolichol-phosphate mannosyltransferase